MAGDYRGIPRPADSEVDMTDWDDWVGFVVVVAVVIGIVATYAYFGHELLKVISEG